MPVGSSTYPTSRYSEGSIVPSAEVLLAESKFCKRLMLNAPIGVGWSYDTHTRARLRWSPVRYPVGKFQLSARYSGRSVATPTTGPLPESSPVTLPTRRDHVYVPPTLKRSVSR